MHSLIGDELPDIVLYARRLFVGLMWRLPMRPNACDRETSCADLNNDADNVSTMGVILQHNQSF